MASVMCLHISMQEENILNILMPRVVCLHFSMQEENILKHTNAKFHLCAL